MNGGRRINYVRQDIPSVDIPPYRGETYEDMTPDTLDITERIELAVNGVTGPTDPAADCEIYFWADFFHEPPVLTHDYSDWCQGKFMEALPLLRIASGSDLNSHVDEAWKDVLLKSIGPDGLSYFPLTGDAWYRVGLPDAYPVFRADGKAVPASDESVDQFAAVNPCGRLINTMTVYYLRDGNPIWKDTIEHMVRRLAALAIHREDYCFFPKGLFAPGARIPADLETSPTDAIIPFGGARLIEGLARYFLVTGYEPALELARKLVHAVRYHSAFYDRDGAFINRRTYTRQGQATIGTAPTDETVCGGHFHGHAVGVLNMLEYALAADDRELLAFCRKSYEWARTQGSALTGFFPTVINPHVVTDAGLPYSGVHSPWYDEFEICELADMIAIALKLSSGGAGDYYDDVERWTRNFFAEGQLTRIDWIDTRPRYMDTRPLFPNETSERVAERSLGGFGGWLSGNDWATRMGLMHCCTGNATRTLYYIWEHILHYEAGVLKVNLLLNHASPRVDVHSYSPYEGRLDLKIKKACKMILIHIPEWVEEGSDQLCIRVNGVPCSLSWEGRYAQAGKGTPGDEVVMTYPLPRYMIKEQLGDAINTLTLKGNTVVDIDPKGRHCPLFQRAHYREDQVRWRKMKRYVPEERIWW